MDAPPELPDDLIPVAQAARHAQVTIDTVYNWIRKGQLAAWKRVGRLYVSRADLGALFVPVEAAAHPETFAEQRSRRQHTRQTLERFGLHLNGPT